LHIRDLFVVYGAWLEKVFNVSIVALGIATGVIGIAELVGEILVATISDRFGLKSMLHKWVKEGSPDSAI
jgi:predicted MFS family arabinose efflux permease